MADSTKHRAKRSRLLPLAWVSGLLAAGLLVLGVSGTLSTWTAAILNNNTNTAVTSNAVVLQEKLVGGAINADCQSSAGGFSNTSTCTEINKYGGTTTPIAPAGNQITSVTLTNIGSGPASKLVLTPSACTQTPTAGTGTPVNPANLCSSADFTLNLSCVDGITTTGTAYTDLAYTGTLAAFTAKTHTAAIAANASITCTFTVSLSATASPLDGGIQVSQPLKWELDA